MTPKRFTEETEYYDRLLVQYQQMLDGKLDTDEDLLTSNEIIHLMQELKDTNDPLDINKEQMQNIARNSMILLMTLFEHKDESITYKDYCDLTESEKVTLKAQFAPILPIN
jgi:hypothetical protein